MVFFPSYRYLMNIFNLLFKFFIQNPASYLTFPNSPNCFYLSGPERLLSWLGAVEIIASLELRNIWCGCLYLWYLQYPSSGLHYLSLACLVTGGIFLTTATVYSTALITIVPRLLLFLTATRYHVSLHSLALAYSIQTSDFLSSSTDLLVKRSAITILIGSVRCSWHSSPGPRLRKYKLPDQKCQVMDGFVSSSEILNKFTWYSVS